MHVVPTCHFDDAGRRRLALLDDPKLLDRRPSRPPLRTRQNRNLAHVCSFVCKSISKLSQARLSPGRRPSPEGYAGVGQRDEDSEDHRVNRLAARANDVGGRDRLAVSRCRRVCGARPEARRDEEQEFPRSDNRQLWCSSPTAKCCSINFGKCAGVDPRHQQYQPLSFHPELYSNGSAIRTTTPCQGLGICMSTICTFSNGGNAKESSDELRGQ